MEAKEKINNCDNGKAPSSGSKYSNGTGRAKEKSLSIEEEIELKKTRQNQKAPGTRIEKGLSETALKLMERTEVDVNEIATRKALIESIESKKFGVDRYLSSSSSSSPFNGFNMLNLDAQRPDFGHGHNFNPCRSPSPLMASTYQHYFQELYRHHRQQQQQQAAAAEAYNKIIEQRRLQGLIGLPSYSPPRFLPHGLGHEASTSHIPFTSPYFNPSAYHMTVRHMAQRIPYERLLAEQMRTGYSSEVTAQAQKHFPTTHQSYEMSRIYAQNDNSNKSKQVTSRRRTRPSSTSQAKTTSDDDDDDDEEGYTTKKVIKNKSSKRQRYSSSNDEETSQEENISNAGTDDEQHPDQDASDHRTNKEEHMCAWDDCKAPLHGKQIYCRKHSAFGGCQWPACTKYAVLGKSRFCVAHAGDTSHKCKNDGCQKQALKGGFCKRHGGGRRCDHEGCTKLAQTGGRCTAHGGGTRCREPDCTKHAKRGGYCISHGGGRPCAVEGCNTPARTGGKCIAHGGGRRCKFPECTHGAAGRTEFCVTHGGGRRCSMENCIEVAVKGGTKCKYHAD